MRKIDFRLHFYLIFINFSPKSKGISTEFTPFSNRDSDFVIQLNKNSKFDAKFKLDFNARICKNICSKPSKSLQFHSFFQIVINQKIVRYQMKHDQKIECGGGYIKVGPKPDDMTAFGKFSYFSQKKMFLRSFCHLNRSEICFCVNFFI